MPGCLLTDHIAAPPALEYLLWTYLADRKRSFYLI